MSRPITEMLNESIAVLTSPSVATFERVERNGTKQDALQYVIAAAVVSAAFSAVIALIFAVVGNASMMSVIGALIRGLVIPVAGFYVFAYLVHLIGKQQGGTGTEDEVFYTIALISAPLLAFNSIIGSIPLLNCLALLFTFLIQIYMIYLTYLAVRASMNLESTPAIITTVVAWVVQFIVRIGISIILTVFGLAAS
ncbi:hypothetical protein ARMA_1345 [Ardenticatena maritima]|uniref:Yip1 domain-containing protein n=1 Tax=Ardenticatena maritima TaxID=872965 RepID=A0A0M8K8I1_9CHLR|nr:Yip1 family protein [Ardenticatena maritima]KPL89227.1 hypothetical protein SE16_01640 [Ardenticatena maritima]GAP62922.1 hypothetical protein ARMA_1345 [Ardenticatena maritima]